MKTSLILSFTLLLSGAVFAQDSAKQVEPTKLTPAAKVQPLAITIPTSKIVAKTNKLENSTDTFVYFLPMQQVKPGEQPKMGSFVFKDLFVLLKSKKANQRVEGLTILAASKEMPPLSEVLHYMIDASNSTSVAVRESTILAAGEYLEDLEILPLFESILKTGRPDDKIESLQALFNMDWCDEVELLVASALWDNNEDVREIALSVINNSISKDGYDSVEDAKKYYLPKLKK